MGAVLYQMLTGAPPFEGDSSQEIVGKHLAEPPPAPSDKDARIPRWLSNVITRSLQKRPAERYQSAAMMLDALGGADVRSSPAPGSMDSATELVPSGERRTAQPPNRPTAGVAGKAAGRLWFGAGLLALFGGIAVGFWMMTAPRLAFENRLIYPVRLTVAGQEHLVDSASSLTVRLPRGGGHSAAWSLVRPTNQRGEPLGVELSGTVNVTAADAGAAEGAWFVPLITNNTGRPLSVIVNAGLQGATPCRCMVPPGAVRQAIGYYPVFQNSTVRVRDRDGRTATFTNLGPEVDRRSGVVRLAFVATDLR
jgi:hypothetical protein